MRFRRSGRLLAALVMSLLPLAAGAQESAPAQSRPVWTAEIPFKSHDGRDLFGILTLPEGRKPLAIVVYVQTAEGATVHMKRPKGRGATFNYFDLYREKLPAMDVGFFSYEGRGIRMGDEPPRFEKIDWPVFDTGTLDNKVRDALSAIQAVKKREALAAVRIFLMGASEGTLLAVEAASRAPQEVAALVLYGVLATNMRENFRYIMSDGAFLQYRIQFDASADGRISKAEFEADPKKFRARALRNAPFSVFDKDGDGWFTAEELCLHTKPYLDAIAAEDFEVLQAWAKTSAAVAVPNGWFKDHFAHQPLWTFLANLDIPVGFFHGALDTNTPIASVRKLEKEAKSAGKTKFRFAYFEDLDHTLDIADWFTEGRMPAGHEAIFAFIRELAGAK
jgi:pimeloyl-ACP methyl ester carboxylesterase